MTNQISSQVSQICRTFRKGGGGGGGDGPHPLGDALVYFIDHMSENVCHLLGHDSYGCAEHGLRFSAEPVESQPPDGEVEENRRFRYMLLRGRGPADGLDERVLCIFHGLNERDLSQYLRWAYSAWERDGVTVVVFPLSFSITRVYHGWLGQIPDALARRREIPGNDYEHPFNATISERLSARPERLWWGAVQSYMDVVDFARGVRGGRHPFIAPGAAIDLLGFSSGGFIALTLLLDNPGGLFDDSRACLFATCVAMRDLIPSSRYILDRAAEDALRSLYVDHFDTYLNARMRHWLAHPEGGWFGEWCGRRPDMSRTWARMREVAPRVLGIANRNDQVFPYGAMLNALQGVERDTGVRVEVLDLGIHERPFACPDYHQRDARFAKVTLDEQLYGDAYRRFIDLIVGHTGRRAGRSAGR
jgi:hypothetical protein